MNANKVFSPREAKQFAVSWALVVSSLGGVAYFRQHTVTARILWSAGAFVGLLGLIVPMAAGAFTRSWMTMARRINFLNTKLLLVLIFYGVLTPTALVCKLFGRDALGLKKSKAKKDSYWQVHDRVADKSSYRHLY